jgi:hypothetical protein
MRDALLLVLIPVVATGAFALAGILLTDFLGARREQIKARTAARERESMDAMASLRHAMDAKDDLIDDLREDRNHWRELHLASQDGWYGRRRT